MRLNIFGSAAILCGGALLLSGCSHSSNQPDSAANAAMTPPHAAPPAQAEVQEIQNESHIPDARKAAIEAEITHGNGLVIDKLPKSQ